MVADPRKPAPLQSTEERKRALRREDGECYEKKGHFR